MIAMMTNMFIAQTTWMGLVMPIPFVTILVKKTHYCIEWYNDDYTKNGLSSANAIFNNFSEIILTLLGSAEMKPEMRKYCQYHS